MGVVIRYEKLGYVELMVTDLERSAAFYREVVGLKPAGRAPPNIDSWGSHRDPRMSATGEIASHRVQA